MPVAAQITAWKQTGQTTLVRLGNGMQGCWHFAQIRISAAVG